MCCADHLGQRFIIDCRIVEGQFGRDDPMSLVLDHVLQLPEGGLLFRREKRMEVLVISSVVVQIIRVAAKRIQQAEGVIFEGGPELPVGVAVNGDHLCREAMRVRNLGSTEDEKTELIKNLAHRLLLRAEVPSCLESICSGSPCSRSNSGELLNAPGHVRLVGEAQLDCDVCQGYLSIPNRA